MVLLLALNVAGGTSTCVQQYNATLDLFPHKVTADHAEDYNVSYHNHYKVVHNLRANEKYVLYQCGTPAPSGYDGYKMFSIPLSKVAVEDTTSYKLLELLGEHLTVQYMQTQYALSPCSQLLVQMGNITNLETNTTIKTKQLLQVDALFTYGVSSVSKSIAITASADPGPLQRAEWVEFMSLFFNKEAEAMQVFEGIRDRYLCHRKQVSEHSVKPVVAWAYYSSWSKEWVITNAAYKHYYLRDAGAQLVGSTNADMKFNTTSGLHAALENVDILIDETYSAGAYTFSKFLDDYGLQADSTLKFVQNGAVWRFDRLINANYGLDWFAGALVEADVVLEDLITVIQPGHSNVHDRTWLRQLSTDEGQVIEQSSSCVDPTLPATPRADNCRLTSCVATYNSSTDYFPHKLTADHAEDYNVSYHNHYKVVHNLRANEKYVLYQCGTPAPSGYDGYKMFSIPLSKVAVEDSSAQRLLELLGERLAVRYMQTTYAQSPCFQYLVEEGEVGAMESAFGGDAAKRALQLQQVEALFQFLASTDSKTIAITASADPGPLQRAEWVEFMSLFFNKEAEAMQVFEGIRDRYLCHRKQVSEHSVKPVVAWAYYSSWSKEWVITNAAYKHYYLRDAGAQLVGSTNADMKFNTTSGLHAALENVDILIDETYSAGAYTFSKFLDDYGLQADSTLKFVQNGAVWRFDRLINANYGLDWFAGALVEADVVLEDLITVIQPGHSNVHDRTWLRQLSTDEGQVIQQSSSCVDPTLPATPRADNCRLTSCVATYNSSTDYFPHKLTADHAEDYNVSYHNHYKVVHNLRANEKYVLYQCGTPAPSGYDGYKMFSIPLSKVAVEDSSAQRLLELLGERLAVRYMQTTYAQSPCFQYLVEEGEVGAMESAFGGDAAKRASQLQQVDALFQFLASTDSKTIAITASADPGPLQRAEWVEFMSLFFNKEAEAMQVFEGIRDRYLCHRKQVSEHSVKPVVAWAYYSSWSKEWVITNAAYKHYYLRDAGAQLVGSTNADMKFNTTSGLHAALENVDILIDETYSAGAYTFSKFLDDYGLQADSTLKFVQNGAVWRFDRLINANYGLDWFAGALVEADVVLEDLITVIQPGHSNVHDRTWLRQLSTDEGQVIQQSSSCVDPTLPATPRADNCRLTSCVATYNSSIDYFPHKLTADHAEDYNVSYHNHYKVVHNLRANEKYVLYQCGTPAPSGYDGYKMFSIPLSKVAVEDSSAQRLLELLGERLAVRYMQTTYAQSPCFQYLVEEGEVGAMESAFGGDAAKRALQLQQVEALFQFLASTDSKTIAITASADPGPLQRAEWVEFMSLFFNKEAEAMQVFEGIRDRYLCHRKQVSEHSVKPVVAWAYYSSWSKEWVITNAAYKHYYLRDAGAQLVGSTNADMKFNTTSGLHAALENVDILIDETYSAGAYTFSKFLDDYGLQADSTLKFVQNGAVWRFDRLINANYGLDWFAGALVEADVVLEDLITVIQPGHSNVHDRTWLRQLSTDEGQVIQQSSSCVDPTLPATPRADNCRLTSCVATYNSSTDYFPHKLTADHAEDYNVSYHNHYKVVHNLRANEKYVLYQCGTPAPSGYDGYKMFSIPLSKVAVEDSSAQRLLELLGERLAVRYMQTTYAQSPCFQYLVEEGEVGAMESAFGGDAAKRASQLQQVEALFQFLASTDSKTIAITASADPGPLQRAEWVEFMSLFFNKEAEAMQVFEGIRDRYLHHRKQVSEHSVKPVVAWAYYSSWSKEWVITNAAYKHYYLRDAGAQLVGSTNADMKFNTTSGLHAALENVDILIDETYSAGAYTFSKFLDDYGLQADSTLKFVQNGAVWRFDRLINANYGLDWFAGALVEADVVLEDLITVIQPGHSNVHDRTWLRQLSTDEGQVIQQSSSCVDPTLPATPRADNCRLTSCVATYNSSTDYFPHKLTADHAEDYNVSYHNHYKVVYNLRANEKYVLYQCGTPAPSGYDGYKMFSIPLSKVAVEDSSAQRLLELLGERLAVRYMQTTYAQSPCFQYLVEEGEVGAMESAFGGDAAKRALQLQQVEALFQFLASTDSKTIAITASADPGPLQRAEWVEFMSLFFNKEAEAMQVFEGIRDRYLCHRKQVSEHSVKPVVAWAYYSSWSKEWVITNAAYKHYYLRDAGAQLVGGTNADMKFNTTSGLHAALENVDILIDETYSAGAYTFSKFLDDYGLQADSTLKFVQNGAVWRFDRLINANYGLDWFAGALVEADVVLEDLITVIQPGHSNVHDRTWLRQLSTDEGQVIQQSSSCVDPTLPATPRADNCRLTSCVATYNSSTDYFPHKLTADHAEDYNVSYHNHYKVVHNLRANEKYVLYQCGTPAPSGYDGYKMFSIPLSKVAVEDSSAQRLLELLGERLAVRYMQTTYAQSPCFQYLVEEGEVGAMESAFGGDAAKRASQLQQVDALFQFSASTDSKTIAITASADPGPLQRAEWVEFMSLFFNKEAEAMQVFEGIRDRYLCHRKQVSEHSVKPVVAWAYYSSWSKEWVITNAAYKHYYLRDAGAQLVGSTNADMKFNTTSGLHAALENVDILIDETYSAGAYTFSKFLDDYGLQADSTLKFVQNGAVWRFDRLINANYGLDWFAGALVEADVVLEDLITVIQPGHSNVHDRTWLRQLSTDEGQVIQQSSSCMDPTLPATPWADNCRLTSCVATYNSSTDYFPHKLTADHAEDYNVSYHNHYKVVHNLRANEKYVLYQCGTPAPSGYDGYKMFSIPLSKVAVEDSSAQRLLELLGERLAVRYMQTTYAQSPCFQYLVEEGEVGAMESAFGGDAAKRASQLQQVDALFQFSPSTDSKTIAITASADPGPLQRAEWVEFMSLFFNKEAEAMQVFEGIRDRYLCHRKQVSEHSVKPVVAWAYYSSWSKEWVITNAAYKHYYLRDAGAQLVGSTNADMKFNTTSGLHAALENVDILIDETYSAGAYTFSKFLDDYGLQADSTLKFVQNGAVWRFDRLINANYGLDWFAGALVEADVVLEDLITVIQPGHSNVHDRTWLRQLSTDEGQVIQQSSSCVDPTLPATPRADNCRLTSCVATYNSSIDYFPHKLTADHAEDYNVSYHNHYKVVHNLRANEKYVLYQCGTPAPSGYDGYKMFSIPLSKVAVEDSSAQRLLELLGERLAVRYMQTTYAQSPCFQYLVEEGEVGAMESAFGGDAAKRASQLQQVDALFQFLASTDSKTIAITASADPGPLQRAEWVEFMSLFFNKEAEAMQVFEGIRDRYLCHRKQVSEHSVKPVVAWAYYSSWSKEWVITNAAYKHYYLRDAGAQLVGGTNADMKFNTTSGLHAALENVDILIDETYSAGAYTFSKFLDDYGLQADSTLKFVQNGAVWRFDRLINANYGLDWFAGALVEADVVLEDLITVIQPGHSNVHDRTWLRQLSTDEGQVIQQSSSCVDPTLPATPRADNCRLTSCVATYNSSIDYFPHKLTADHAEDYNVSYHNHYKVVHNLRANEKYVLYQCGTPAPSGYDGYKMFSIPLSKVAVEDSSAQRLLELLGERLAVRYMQTTYAQSPCFQYLVEEGEVGAMESAFGGDAAKRASQLQQVDALFQFSPSTDSKTIAITASADPGPLQRAEWVEFMSLFFNKEAEAMQVFEGIRDRYLCHRKQVSEHSVKPVVAWAYYSSWSKEWVITNAAYKHYYLRDAGAQLVGGTNADMKFNTTSGLHAALENVDILIDETYSAGAYTFSKFLDDYGLQADSTLKFVQNGAVWRFDRLINANYGLDWFAGALVEADVVLEDLITVIQPGHSNVHDRTWLRQLSTDEGQVIQQSSSCVDPTLPATPRADNCRLTSCVATYNSSIDYFPHKLTADHAEDYNVSYHNHYKVVHNLRANEKYVLYQCGTPAPSGYDGYKMFSIPLSKVAVEDSSAQRLLELLGERLAVRYMQTTYAQSPCFQYLVEEGEVGAMESAFGGDAAKRASQLQQVDALFQFLASTDSKTIAITASADPGPLQRAEWVEFMSLFFNKEAEAMQVFEGIRDRYLCHRKQVSEHSVKPVVAWAYYSSWSKEWVITNAAYKHYYLRDAGAQLVGSTNADMKFNTTSGLHAALENVDILIDETYSAGAYTFSKFLDDYGLQADSTLKFVQNGAVWRFDRLINANYGLDWFAGALVEADVVLEDLITVIQPGHTNVHDRTWLRQLSTDEGQVIQQSSSCVDPTLPATPRADNCRLTSCVATYNSSIDYFPHKLTADHAEDYNVSYHNHYKVVHNLRANEKYVLYQCGTPAPSGYDGYKMFSIPLSKVAVEDSSAQRLLELLGERLAVRYMQTTYAQSPCFQYLVEEGEVGAMESAFGGDAAKRASQLQQVDALFQFSPSTDSKTIAITASADPGPLQRAEWVEFMSLFFNKEAEAMQVFEGIRDRYLCHRKQVSEHSVKPVVAWAYYSSWSKEWVITNAAYKHYYLRDAGAQLVGGTNADMKFNTTSGLHAALENVDILIDETYSAGAYTFSKFLDDYGLQADSTLKFVQNGAVWRFDRLINANYGLDWFAGALVEADVVLEDLITVIQPGHSNVHDRTWLRQLSTDEGQVIQQSSSCVDPTLPATPRADNCRLTSCVATYNSSIDYFPHKLTADHAEDYNVSYHNHYKVVHNLRANEKYVLYQCGTPAPSGYDGYKMFSIPLSKVAVEDSSAQRLLELLGERLAVRYMQTTYAQSPCFQYLVEEGEVGAMESAFGGDAAKRASQLQQVDALFQFLASTDSKTIAITASADPGPLQRAEWVEFMSLFFNKEAEAMQVFEGIRDRYLCHRKQVSEHSVKPVVAWAYYSSWSKEWVITNAAYKHYYLRDAGAQLVGGTNADMKFNTTSGLHAALENVDILIDETYSAGAYTFSKFLDDYGLQADSTLKFVQNGAVWRFDRLINANYGLDWFAGALVEADVVLEDLITVIQPGHSNVHDRTWLRQLSTDEGQVIQQSSSCVDPTLPATPRADNCRLTSCVATYNSSIDYFPHKLTADHAEDYNVSYHNHYKVVHNLRANEKYVLYQCGTPAPSGYDGYKMFSIPLSKVAVEDSSAQRLLELLGERLAVRYMQTTYAQSPCFQYLVEEGEVGAMESAFGGDAAKRASQLQQVDALFQFSPSTDSKTIAITASADPGPLQRAEWVEFMSLFFNKEAEAMQVFEGIRDRYLCHRKQVSEHSVKPVVAWAYYSSWSKEWVITNAAYKHYYLRDAGAQLVGSTNADMKFNTTSGLHAALENVDILIDETYSAGAYTFSKFLDDYGLQADSTLKFVQNGAVWRFDRLINANYGLDWFAGALVEADVVLEDLITVIQPGHSNVHDRTWLRQLSTDEGQVIQQSSSCVDPTLPATPRADACASHLSPHVSPPSISPSTNVSPFLANAQPIAPTASPSTAHHLESPSPSPGTPMPSPGPSSILSNASGHFHVHSGTVVLPASEMTLASLLLGVADSTADRIELQG